MLSLIFSIVGPNTNHILYIQIIKPDSKGGLRSGLGDQSGTFNFASGSQNNNQSNMNRNRDLANPNDGRDYAPGGGASDLVRLQQSKNKHQMNPKLVDEAKQKFFGKLIDQYNISYMFANISIFCNPDVEYE